MPLYEYKCSSCGKVFEVIQKFADEPLRTHPECGGTVERLLSAPAFHLKGTGWYATDYAKKSNGADAKPKDEKSKDEKSSESKDDSAEKAASPAPAADNKTAASTTPAPSSSETKPSASS